MMDRKNERNVAQEDAQKLYIGNLNTVEFDLTLPEQGAGGSTITWESDNPLFLQADGKVVRPAFGRGSRDVVLRAHLRYGEETAERNFTVHILEEKNLRFRSVRPVALSAAPGATFFLPAAAVAETEAGDIIAHPVTWDGGTKRCFSACGSQRASGVLTGTQVPVQAEITVCNCAAPPKPRVPAVEFFAPAEVGLDPDGPFWDAQSRSLTHLLSISDDQMLYNFRFAAGLDTLGAPPMAGWDAPDSQIRGHTTGHYLSALALCWEATGNPAIRRKAAYMVRALRACQEKFSATPGFHKGFLSGYSEEQFDQLERLVPYPEIWAPYYTLHKILAGLLDCQRAFGLQTALQAAAELGLWVYDRLSRLNRDQRERMWSTYIAGEFGGMNESLARLCQLTGDRRYLQAARMFENDKLFFPMYLGVDTLTGMHANQHIPQVIGALQMYEVCGEERYYQIAAHFWQIVTRDHIYAIGGTGEGEMFHQPGRIARLLSNQTAETCASYNMLKLTAELYHYEPRASYMDYYERTMVNHILASGEQRPTGASTYFMPLAPGCRKSYHGDDENSCCHGTGMENHFKYASCVYSHSERALFINLFLNSHVRWRERCIALHQTVCRERDAVRSTLRVSGGGALRLLVRRPYWCADTPEFAVNGGVIVPEEADGYCLFERSWSDGDLLECRFPCALRLERAPDDQDRVAVCWGPFVLAALSERAEPLHLDSGCSPEALLKRTGDGIEFLLGAGNVRMIPLFQVRDEAYQVYLAQ